MQRLLFSQAMIALTARRCKGAGGEDKPQAFHPKMLSRNR
jgi:hypothetical protein